MRHPNLLAFRDSVELEQQGETVLYLITEPVTPLAQVLEELDIDMAAKCELCCGPLQLCCEAAR